jgi:hypothetical protein
MENKRKHLEMIQAIIGRMSGSLFYLKGWTITLVVGFLALLAKDTSYEFIYIASFLVVIFWLLDGYFLSQERCFRALYDDVRKLNEEDIDFSMDIKKYRKLKYNTWFSAISSKTILLFYGLLALLMFGIMCEFNGCFYGCI